MQHFLLIVGLHVTKRVDASISTIKYRNGPHGGAIGPHISPWILSKNAGFSLAILFLEGLIISFPSEQAVQLKSLDGRTLMFFNVCPSELFMILCIITAPG